MIEYLEEDIKNYIFAKVSDVTFNDNLVSKKSTEGYLFTLYGKPINWQSIKQKLVTKSSIEAKLLALLHIVTKLI